MITKVRAAAAAASTMMAATVAIPTWADRTEPLDFRVCADPNNLPFSSSDRAGLENKLAELVATGLGKRVNYAGGRNVARSHVTRWTLATAMRSWACPRSLAR
jgi:hypothetical protein